MANYLWLVSYSMISTRALSDTSTTQIPANWILAGALIVLLIGLVFEQIKKIFKKKKRK